MSLPRILPRSLLTGAAFLLLLIAACSNDTDTKSEAEGAAATPSTSYSVVTTDNKFNITRMTVPANQQVTVTVRNDGQALHNWHLLNVRDAGGQAIETRLLKKGESATVTFTLTTPGRYDFRCDTHPAEMKGTLTVQ